MFRRRNVKERLGQYKEYEELFSRLEIEFPLLGRITNDLPLDDLNEEEKIMFEELKETGYKKIELLRQIAEREHRKLRKPVLRYFESDVASFVLEMYARFYSDLRERVLDAIENSCIFRGRLYTTSEVAEYLGIRPEKVRELLRPVTIDSKPLRKGYEYVYKESDVERLKERLN